MLTKILVVVGGTILGAFLGYSFGYGIGANIAGNNLPWDFVYKEGLGYIAGGILGKEIGIQVGALCGFLVSLLNVFFLRDKKKRP